MICKQKKKERKKWNNTHLSPDWAHSLSNLASRCREGETRFGWPTTATALDGSTVKSGISRTWKRRMGCCASQNADSKASRISRWRSTGIVALRDAKLKACSMLLFFFFFSLVLSNINMFSFISSGSRMFDWKFWLFVRCYVSKQTFPDEVLGLEKSVRTLDLTHNKLGDFVF